ncbi:MAG TPA: DUF4331 family protein [Urbifossiella sp.]|jgi:hypothetical protein|nr:DUF4331 family protein [Urbifossiella sp.]
MSHHFDTPTAKEDPRINLCDYYLFRGRPGTVAMALTVNPDAGRTAPDTFRDEGLYAFRFDLDGDAREEVTFKITFGPPAHVAGTDHRHVQSFEVRRARGADALRGIPGERIASGNTGGVVNAAGVSVYAGPAPDVFAGDAAALEAFRSAFYKEGRFHPAAFQNRKNYFAGRNVTAVVLEVPVEMVGRGVVRGWATVSLVGHAPEVQVSRWGLPLVTHLFMPDPDMREAYNRSPPGDDATLFGGQIGSVVERLAGLAGATDDPHGYAERLVARLCPSTPGRAHYLTRISCSTLSM